MGAMLENDLWTRIKRARIVQVILVYLGASWAILQAVDVLLGTLALPEWVGPLVVILLLVGLVIIGGTAWVQSLPSTTAREEAGEVPGDWEIAPADIGRSLAAGRLPHLTWGRAVLGGVVVLSLLFGASGLFVAFSGSRSSLGPAEAGASSAAEGIAVIPFEVRGDGLEIWREGMMDLLSNNLDGVGGYRTIDARTVMARWRKAFGEDAVPDLQLALRAAGATGARYAIAGSVVGLGENVRLVANLYDLDTGKEVAQGRAEGSQGDVLALADELAVETMRALFQATGREGGDVTAESMTTTSLPALRAFLLGERHYRRGEFAQAVQEYERAVAADSTFAIALIRLSEGYGWLESQGSERMVEVGDRAKAHAHRLSPRYQFVMTAWDALNHGSADGVGVLLDAVQKYPDDPEAWWLLAETYIHIGDATYSDSDDITRALDRAVSLDPDFAPYYIHVIEQAVIRGDLERARDYSARYRALTSTVRELEHIEYAIRIYHGTDDEAKEAAEALRREDPQLSPVVSGTFGLRMDQFDRTALLDPALEAAQGSNRDPFRMWMATSTGSLERADRYLDSLALSGANKGIQVGHASELWETLPPPNRTDLLDPDLCEDPSPNATCYLFLGSAFARGDMWDRHGEVIRRLGARVESLVREDPAADVAYPQAVADFLEAYGHLRHGDAREARPVLESLRTRSDAVGQRARLAMGEMEASQGRTEEAIRHFKASQVGYQRPRAVLELARLSGAAGRPDEAIGYWQRFLTLTRDGDADLPQAREARQALERLGG